MERHGLENLDYEMECCGKHLSFILTNKLYLGTVVTR